MNEIDIELLTAQTSLPLLVFHLAAALCVVGYFLRRQLLLRLFLLAGTSLFILFCTLSSEVPWRSGIFWGTAMIAANIFTTMRAGGWIGGAVDWENSKLHGVFPTMIPDDFRQLNKIVTWETVEAGTVLCRENQAMDCIYYVIGDHIRVRRNGKTYFWNAPIIIGEIAWLTKQNASSTVILPEDCRVASIKATDLECLMARNDTLREAVKNGFNQALAGKFHQNMEAEEDKEWRARLVVPRSRLQPSAADMARAYKVAGNNAG